MSATRPIYRLFNPVSGDHFASRDLACEGMQADGTYGWVATAAIGEAPRPLLRCISPNTGDHLTTVAPTECTAAGYLIEGGLGYVP